VIDARSQKLLYRLIGMRRPVAHGHGNDIIAIRTEDLLQSFSLTKTDFFQWGAAAYLGIDCFAFRGTSARYYPGQKLLQKGRTKPDNLSVGKKVEKKWPDVVQGVRPPHVQEDNAVLAALQLSTPNNV
jgi:hypothetical protein